MITNILLKINLFNHFLFTHFNLKKNTNDNGKIYEFISNSKDR